MKHLRLIFPIALFGVLILFTVPAMALPGQNEIAFKKWANTIPVLKSFAQVKSIRAIGGNLNKDFKLKGQSSNLLIHFNDSGIEEFDHLEITKATIAPAKNNISFIAYLSGIFGASVGNDFATSQDVYTTYTQDGYGNKLWASVLKGKKYSYVVAFMPQEQTLYFDILSLKSIYSTVNDIKSGAFFSGD